MHQHFQRDRHGQCFGSIVCERFADFNMLRQFNNNNGNGRYKLQLEQLCNDIRHNRFADNNDDL